MAKHLIKIYAIVTQKTISKISLNSESKNLLFEKSIFK